VTAIERLTALTEGQAIPFGGDRVARVDADLSAAFSEGDRLVVVQDTGDLLHIPAEEHELVRGSVSRAAEAFAALQRCDDGAITDFFESFAAGLEDDRSFAPIAAANAADVSRARQRGRSTTRLELSASMRQSMIGGLRGWRDSPIRRHDVLRTIDHDGWSVEERRAPLGVVGFVFEGRPNVFADAAGVVRSGNTVVFRIGSDALATAEAIVEHASTPALDRAGLPAATVQLLASPSRAVGWALFSDRRLSLAVARGSGSAVAQLGAVARQAGVPVSLHGTGGAWLVASARAGAERLRQVVEASLDRKVCNTLNVVCVARSRAADLVPVVVDALEAGGARRGVAARLHVELRSIGHVDAGLFDRKVDVVRADGTHPEPFASPIDEVDLATEWEWDASPEISLVVVDDIDHAVALCNRWSPRFVASLISDDAAEHEQFYASVDAPFVGDGFTRWVDGQYALSTPELGLSNWQGGRLLGRGGVLAGDGVHTVRHVARFSDPSIHR
jgi:glutamate-5-semialdehyde dehydrogenase